MSIWFNKNISITDLHDIGRNTMADHLGMQWHEMGEDFLSATMPVDDRTRQPFGLLHGGASAALAETVGSVAAALVTDQDKFYCVGMEINANHVRGVREGRVTAKASPLHIGGASQVWDIRITNEAGKLVCVSRLTVAVLRK